MEEAKFAWVYVTILGHDFRLIARFFMTNALILGTILGHDFRLIARFFETNELILGTILGHDFRLIYLLCRHVWQHYTLNMKA